MAYTPATILPTIAEMAWFQWARPDAENPRLSAPISANATTIKFNYPPLDHDGNVVSKAFLAGMRNENSYVESILVPAGALSADGLTATGVVRGVRLEGLDWTTGDSSLAVQHKSGDSVFCQISGITQMLNNAALNGEIATGGTEIKIGDGTDSDVTLIAALASDTGFIKKNATSGKAQYSNDGAVWNDIDDVTAGSLVVITGADTTPGNLNSKVVAGTNITLNVLNPGGNETLEIVADTKNTTVVEHETYDPAYLTGGSSAEGTFNNWLAVLDGEFAITVDGVAYDVTAIDFTGVTSMADVATYIQTALRTQTTSTETVAWSVDHFVITSVDTTSSSAMTVTSAVGGGVGTDISGAGASNWMDADTGNGVVTDAVLDATADAGKVVALDADGRVGQTIVPYIEKSFEDYPQEGLFTLRDNATATDGLMYPYGNTELGDATSDSALDSLGYLRRSEYTIDPGDSYTRAVNLPGNIASTVEQITTSAYKLDTLAVGSAVNLGPITDQEIGCATQGKYLLTGADYTLELYEIDETDGSLTYLDSVLMSTSYNVKAVVSTGAKDVFSVIYTDSANTEALAVSVAGGAIDITYSTEYVIATAIWEFFGKPMLYDQETILFPVITTGYGTGTFGICKLTVNPTTGVAIGDTEDFLTMANSGDGGQNSISLLDDDKILYSAGQWKTAGNLFDLKAAVYTVSTETFGAADTVSSTEDMCQVVATSTTSGGLVAEAHTGGAAGSIVYYPLTISGTTVTSGAATTLTTVAYSNLNYKPQIQEISPSLSMLTWKQTSDALNIAYLEHDTPALAQNSTLESTAGAGGEPFHITKAFGPYVYATYGDSDDSRCYMKPIITSKDVTGSPDIDLFVNDDNVAAIPYGIDQDTSVGANVEAGDKVDIEIVNNSSDRVVVELGGVDCGVY